MPSIRIPESAEPLLPFCSRSDAALENACFDTYADLITFAAACGFHRTNGRRPDDPNKFLSTIYPIDLAIFKNQGLFPNLLLMGLGCERKPEIARDEDRLCNMIEAFADVGCKYLRARHPNAEFHQGLAAEIRAMAREEGRGGI